MADDIKEKAPRVDSIQRREAFADAIDSSDEIEEHGAGLWSDTRNNVRPPPTRRASGVHSDGEYETEIDGEIDSVFEKIYDYRGNSVFDLIF